MPHLQDSNSLPDTIRSIPRDDDPVTESDINFYDYDGSLVYSYSFSEAAVLSSLPAIPTHGGLVAQGWTHTLSHICNAASNEKPVNVGTMYITDDGCTRLYMYLTDENYISPSLTLAIAGSLTLTVDWGDGTVPDTLTSSGTLSHTWDVSSFPSTVVIRISASGTGSFTIGNGLKPLFSSSVYDVYGKMLNKVEFGDKTNTITAHSFRQCYNLQSVSLPAGVTNINEQAFNDCLSLTGFVIPVGVTRISSAAFQSCGLLRSAVIPESVISIENGAFQNCISLDGVVIPDGVTIISGYVFRNCYSLQRIHVPDSVTEISFQAFSICRKLEFFAISETVVQIGNNAFSNCILLSKVAIPDTITRINEYTFDGCSTLREVVISDSVTSIGTRSFGFCYNLYKLDLSAYTDPDALPVLASIEALYAAPSNQTIYVANQTMLNAFRAATNWSNFATRFRVKEA